jgi:hypothetical protein
MPYSTRNRYVLRIVEHDTNDPDATWYAGPFEGSAEAEYQCDLLADGASRAGREHQREIHIEPLYEPHR